MTKVVCLYSHSEHLLRGVITWGGALLALYTAVPVHALSGFPNTTVSFYSDPAAPNDAKLYCDLTFQEGKPACAQENTGVTALLVSSGGFGLGLTGEAELSVTAIGTITTSTDQFGARGARICETAGVAGQPVSCMQITQGGGGGTNPPQCSPKFFITAHGGECQADRTKLEALVGPTAHIDFTKSRNDDRTLKVNVCTLASWECVAPSPIGLGNRKEIQELGTVFTNHNPLSCNVAGTRYFYRHNPYQC